VSALNVLFNSFAVSDVVFFSALMLLVGQQEGHPARKNYCFGIPCLRIKGETSEPGFSWKWKMAVKRCAVSCVDLTGSYHACMVLNC